MTSDLVPDPAGYGDLLRELKSRIRTARVKAALAVNRELVLLYLSIGRDILDRQGQQGWGAKVIDRLSRDLRQAFPGQKGMSPRNLRYMRDLAQDWPDDRNVQQLAAKLPWFHLCTLHDKVKDSAERAWYAQACIEHGWSRSILVMQIESNLFARKGTAITNFERRLPAPQSDLAEQTLKDPYNFEFLTLASNARERELEQGLMDHLQSFLVELGVGFAFVGRQVRLEVGGDEFFIDLLFYHLELRCFVVIELKATDFKPEYAGKLNFYLTAVDEELRHADDQPTIGLLLCKSKNELVAEYALRGMSQPMGISEYELTETLPADLRGRLPTVEDLEAELSGSGGEDDPGDAPE